MQLSFDAKNVPLYEAEGGAVRITGTRVSLASVIHCFQRGDTPEQIVQNFDTLSLRDTYAVITYYLSHREQVQAYLDELENKAEQLHVRQKADPDFQAFRARLMDRQATRENR